MEKKQKVTEKEMREERSPEIREILDRKPSHILRYGTLYLILIFGMAIGIAAMSSASFRAFLSSVFRL